MQGCWALELRQRLPVQGCWQKRGKRGHVRRGESTEGLAALSLNPGGTQSTTGVNASSPASLHIARGSGGRALVNYVLPQHGRPPGVSDWRGRARRILPAGFSTAWHSNIRAWTKCEASPVYRWAGTVSHTSISQSAGTVIRGSHTQAPQVSHTLITVYCIGRHSHTRKSHTPVSHKVPAQSHTHVSHTHSQSGRGCW